MTPLDEKEQEILKAARRITGEHTPVRRANAFWVKVGAAVLAAMVLPVAGWVARSAWGAVKAEITSGKADATVVETVKADVATLQRSVTTLQADVGDVKREQKESSKLLKRVARKLKVDQE